MSHSLLHLRHDLAAIGAAALRAVDAGMLVSRALDRELAAISGSIHVIATGKASQAMAIAAARVVGARLSSALQIGLPGDSAVASFEFVAAGHPVPTADSERAGRRALEVAKAARPGDGLIVLLSGGASALMAVPAAGVTLDDKRAVTDILLHAGADIHALNTVRKHLSAIKGGQLAAATDAACRTLAVSDVVGDDVSVIGSGPTVVDASTFADALSVLERLGVVDACPANAVARLRRGADGEERETPKPGDPRLSAAVIQVLAGRRDAMRGAADEARACGYDVVIVDEPVVGEARVAAGRHRAVLDREASARSHPLAIVSSGETTVRVVGRGKGGRNQEFALALADYLAARGGVAALASLGTDGVDGPTDAAGALVDSTTINRAAQARLPDPHAFLEGNDSYAFFSALGDLIHTGPTGTNVGDIQIALIA